MNECEITFKLNTTEKIVIELGEPLEVVHCCYSATIAFFKENEKTLIGDDSIDHNLSGFSILLKETLNFELKLHESIKMDIGYLYNQDLESFYQQEQQHRPGLTYDKVDGIDYWVGRKYGLWGCGSLAVWFYNNSDGEVIFEITPIYPGGFGNSDHRKQSISYDQWIQNYKPYLIRKISRNVAEQWLIQTNGILEQITENIRRMREQGPL